MSHGAAIATISPTLACMTASQSTVGLASVTT
jgi:hypothetical protein